MKNLSVVGKGDHSEEKVVGFNNTGDATLSGQFGLFATVVETRPLETRATALRRDS